MQPIGNPDTLRSQPNHWLGGARPFICTWRLGRDSPLIMIPRRVVTLLTAGVLACVHPGHVSPSDIEVEIAFRALADELQEIPKQDSVLLLNRLEPRTSEAPDFDAWVGSRFLSPFRSRVPLDLWRRYWSANKSAKRFSPRPQLGDRPVRVLARVGEEDLPDRGGVYSLSRVGLSAGRDSAIVEVHFACRGLCGHGNLWLYVRSETGTWTRHLNLMSYLH